MGGLLLTTFGGMAFAAGAALTPVGCAGGDSTMCAAGLITLPAALLMLAPGIWMIVDSHPRVHITPMQARRLPGPFERCRVGRAPAVLSVRRRHSPIRVGRLAPLLIGRGAGR